MHLGRPFDSDEPEMFHKKKKKIIEADIFWV